MNLESLFVLALLVLPVEALTACAQDSGQKQPQPASQTSVAERAFEHYEAIRTGLSADALVGLKDHAWSLRADAVALAGTSVEAHVDALAKAEKIEDARKHFGELSALLVPKFVEAKIPGVHGFMCPMLKKTWVQKGAEVRNPYSGKSMLSCGSALKDK